MPPSLPLSPVNLSALPIVAVACFVGLVTMINLFEVTRSIRTTRHSVPDILVPTMTAAGLWAAVFSLVQIQLPPEQARYTLPLTALSLLAVITAFITAYLLAAKAYRTRKFVFPVTLGTLLTASSICVLYFSLLAAIQMNGFTLRWTATDVVLAISLPLVAAITSTFIRIRKSWQRISVVATLGAVSISWLHYFSFATAKLTPISGSTAATVTGQSLTLFISVALSLLVLALVLLSGGYLRFQSYFVRNLEASVEAMPVGLAFYDKRDRLMLWNERYANLNPEKSATLKVGMNYREVLEAGIKDALTPAAERQDTSWAHDRSQNHDEGNWLLPYTTNDGWIQVQSRRTRDKGLVTTVADLTTQMQNRISLENKLADANSASLAKSRFLANMRHELRTPLNGVMAVADTLSRTQLTVQQTEMVDLIHQSSRTLQILLSEILDLARVETGRLTLKLEHFDMEALVNEVIALHAAAAHEKDVSFEVSISPSARTWVNADPLRLKQVLGNILSNAVKFTGEGHINLTINAHENLFHFIITDTGIGFPPAFKPRLFGRFEQADNASTRNYEGSGLGLAICYELVSMMKGTIEAESTEGVGSTFSITLPLERVASPHLSHVVPETKLPDQEKEEQGLRILLADDNATNRRVVQLIMETTHARVSEAENGQEALEAYRNAPFDLILMDMQMPVMDGLTAVRGIRQHETETGQRPTPIVMLTANAMPEHVTSSLEAGADAHLSKPFNVTQLLELAQKLTSRTA